MRKKIVNVVIVTLLVLSAMTVFVNTARAQPYTGTVYTRDSNGLNKTNYLEGGNLYFKVELNESVEETITLEVQNPNSSPAWEVMDRMDITTETNGIYRSWEYDVYFDLSMYVSGTYTLNITNPIPGTYTNDTFEVVSNYGKKSFVKTWDDQDRTIPRDNFAKDSNTHSMYGWGRYIYYNATLKDSFGNPLTNDNDVNTTLEHGGLAYHLDTVINTDINGNVEDDVFLEDGDPTGVYYLNITYYYGQEIGHQVIASRRLIVYDADYSVSSSIIPTKSDYETETHYFFEEQDGNRYETDVYYQAELTDQYGWGAEDGTGVYIRIYDEEDDLMREEYDTVSNGEVIGYLTLDSFESIVGDYTLALEDTSDNELDTSTFSVISMDITIMPDQTYYSQGQEIEIRIESNYPDSVDLKIVDKDGQQLEGASWEEQDFQGDIWSAKYTIPDVPDGYYYIRINETDTDEHIIDYPFQIKKFTLSLQTDKDDYLVGETVHAFYTVTNNLDSTQAQGVTVEYRFRYYDDDDNEWKTQSGSSTSGQFSFTVPEKATNNFYDNIYLDAWANDTDDHTDNIFIILDIEDIYAWFTVDSTGSPPSYVPGQTVFVEVHSSVGNDPLENGDVVIKLLKDGSVLTQYTDRVVTDQEGYVAIPIELSASINPGLYDIRVNVTKYDSWYQPPDTTIKVIDESKVLHVHLEKDKDGDYYPGDRLTVTYTITHLGEDVTNQATVKYMIRSSNGVVYDYDFASGGSIDFDIQSDWTKNSDIEISVWASLDNEITGYGELDVDVSSGKILMNADPEYYQAGETVTFEYELMGINNPQSISYKVTDGAMDEVIQTGTPSGGQFTFNVPSLPLDSYVGVVEVITSNGALVSNQLQVNRYGEYNLQIEILTPSDYQNDVYAPGQEIDVQYTFTTSGDAEVPEILILSYNFENGLVYTLQTTEFQGTFTVEVPDGEGTQSLFVNDNFGNFAMEQIDVTKYHMDIEVTTESDYTTGVYTPGQKLKVKYTIMPTGDFDLPSTVTLHYGFISSNTTTIEVSELNGTFTIKVPKGVSGEHHLQAWVGQSMSEENIPVEKDPSWLSKKSPISSLSQIGFIMLILLIIALILGSFLFIIVMFKRPAMGPRTYEEPEEEEEWEEEPVKEQPPTGPRDEYVIEEGEPEPEDTWEGDSIENEEEW